MPTFFLEMASPPEVEKYKEHISKFKCHMPGCPNVSHGPLYKVVPGTQDYDYANMDEYSSWDGAWEADWNTPTNLYRCGHCNEWTCPTHMAS
ncbi:MAG: hypothetical protein NTZ07_04325, partial [Candidatus Woesebacteria bacterium]|nr:hypothetical protein [Candidatus Woesebacteria bacterium]